MSVILRYVLEAVVEGFQNRKKKPGVCMVLGEGTYDPHFGAYVVAREKATTIGEDPDQAFSDDRSDGRIAIWMKLSEPTESHSSGRHH